MKPYIKLIGNIQNNGFWWVQVREYLDVVQHISETRAADDFCLRGPKDHINSWAFGSRAPKIPHKHILVWYIAWYRIV